MHLRIFLLWAAVASLGVAPLAWAASPASSSQATPPSVPGDFLLGQPVSGDPAGLAQMEQRFGVKVTGLHTTAGGYMLDFRYKVVDAAKAAALVAPKVSPYVFDPATGSTFIVPSSPKVGSLKPHAGDKLQPGKQYFSIFSNPGKRIQPGQKVTLVIGEFRIDQVIVY